MSKDKTYPRGEYVVVKDSEVMSGTPSASVLNRDLSDAAYMEELVRQNEALLLEVGHLRCVIKEKGLDQLQHLREENQMLQQTVHVLESNLQDKKHQLEVLESAYNRFDGVHSALRDLAEQRKLVSDMQAQCDTLGEQNAALKVELLKKHQSEEEMQQSLESCTRKCQSQEKDLAEQRALLENAMSQIASLEAKKHFAEKALEEATSAVAEAQCRWRELEEKLATLNEKKCLEEREVEKERDAIQEKMQELQNACMQEVTSRQVAEQQQEELREELCAAKKTLALREQELEKATVQCQHQFEVAHQNEVNELKRALEEKEMFLKQQVDKTAAVMGQMELLKEEKAAIVHRYGVDPDEVERLRCRVETLRAETSKRSALQQRFESMLLSSTSTNSDIKHLFETMLDYQERRDEEMQTRLLIQQIQADDLKKVYEANLKKLRSENKTLNHEIQCMRGNVVDAEEDRRDNDNINVAGTTEAAANPTASEGTPRPNSLPLYANSPSPAQPKDGVCRRGRCDGAASGSSMMNDLWVESSPRMDKVQLTARYQDHAMAPKEGTRSTEMRQCSRCTLLNELHATVCNLCGAPF